MLFPNVTSLLKRFLLLLSILRLPQIHYQMALSYMKLKFYVKYQSHLSQSFLEFCRTELGRAFKSIFFKRDLTFEETFILVLSFVLFSAIRCQMVLSYRKFRFYANFQFQVIYSILFLEFCRIEFGKAFNCIFSKRDVFI